MTVTCTIVNVPTDLVDNMNKEITKAVKNLTGKDASNLETFDYELDFEKMSVSLKGILLSTIISSYYSHMTYKRIIDKE